MRKIKVKKPGLRILKTVFTVAICMIISKLTKGMLNPYDMGVIAVLAIQSDVAESLTEVRKRLGSTIIGGLIGTIFMSMLYIFNIEWLDALLVPLGIFLILYFCSKLINKNEYILIACYVFLQITLVEIATVGWIYPLRIMLNTLVASVVAMLVNLYTPREKKKITYYREK